MDYILVQLVSVTDAPVIILLEIGHFWHTIWHTCASVCQEKCVFRPKSNQTGSGEKFLRKVYTDFSQFYFG